MEKSIRASASSADTPSKRCTMSAAMGMLAVDPSSRGRFFRVNGGPSAAPVEEVSPAREEVVSGMEDGSDEAAPRRQPAKEGKNHRTQRTAVPMRNLFFIFMKNSFLLFKRRNQSSRF